MNKILDFFARTHTPFLHARGTEGTAHLLSALDLQPGMAILEIGFGTGQTLVEVAVRAPEARLFGVDRSVLMLQKACTRLRWSGIQEVQLQLATENGALPYSDVFFHTVYCESVLAILPGVDALPRMFAEIYRVLRPGGRFVCNESLWRTGVQASRQAEINRACLQHFGLIQATEQFPYATDWETLAASAGFQTERAQSLAHPSSLRLSGRSMSLWRSAAYTAFGKLKFYLQPALRRQRKQFRAAEKQFAAYGQMLEGYLFVFKKPH